MTVYCLFTILLFLLKFHVLYFSIVLLSVLTLKDVIAVIFVLIYVVVFSVSSVMSEQSDGVPHRLGVSDNQISSFSVQLYL